MPAKTNGKGSAFSELMFEVTQTFYRFRAAGQAVGFVNDKGGGTVGFMRSLALHGPMTVSELARMRPTSRQRMQQLADELDQAGLVEFIDNPAHKTAKLVRLTKKGQAQHKAMLENMSRLGELLSSGLDENDLRTATRILGSLRKRLSAERDD